MNQSSKQIVLPGSPSKPHPLLSFNYQLPTPYYHANDDHPSFLLLNDGHGKFEQATTARGLGAKRYRRTLAASFVDLDSDGDLDLVTINELTVRWPNGKTRTPTDPQTDRYHHLAP